MAKDKKTKLLAGPSVATVSEIEDTEPTLDLGLDLDFDAPEGDEAEVDVEAESAPIKEVQIENAKPEYPSISEEHAKIQAAGFRVRIPTTVETKPVSVKAETKIGPERIRMPSSTVSAERGVVSVDALPWPVDRFGVTKDLKKAIINVASRIAGNSEKKRIVDEALAVGLEYLDNKFEGDKSRRFR